MRFELIKNHIKPVIINECLNNFKSSQLKHGFSNIINTQQQKWEKNTTNRLLFLTIIRSCSFFSSNVPLHFSFPFFLFILLLHVLIFFFLFFLSWLIILVILLVLSKHTIPRKTLAHILMLFIFTSFQSSFLVHGLKN